MRLAIFDIDGTLTRTNAVDDECFVAAAAEYFGVGASEVDWREAPHITDAGILEWLFDRHRGRPPTDTETGSFRADFVSRLEAARRADPSRFPPVPGACEIFAQLRMAGWSLAMATGAWSPSARLKLTAAGIPLDGIPLVTSDDESMRIMLLRRAIEAAGESGIRFQRIVSVGDGLWDVRAAAELGIPFVGIGSGERAERLFAAGATHVLPDLLDGRGVRVALEDAGVPAYLPA